MVKITYFGHSAFMVSSDQGNFLIDPFIQSTDKFNINPLDIKVDAILLTHSHGDHLGQTMEIALNCKAPVITTFELANYLESKDIKTHAMHIGGTHEFPIGKVRIFPALHGGGIAGEEGKSVAVTPCGFVVTTGEKTIYHSGDTGLTKEFELLGKFFPVDVALLPIGGNFTMGIDDAVIATEMIKPKITIPMHYNTFPTIKADPEEFVKKISEKGFSGKILAPGESLVF